ncbi:MAG: cobyrinate a,c-diamide synthase [Methylococcales bacterium]|nr:cobyrinate a,c-diamide synthase [Methylococcales bacterium]
MLKTAFIVGTQSGCGKTTVMLALLQTLKNQNLTIQAFKAGPDFLDPFWHQVITQSPSYNLDTKMMGVEACRHQLSTQTETVDVALIEGAMGLFDGATGVGELGSSAHLAATLSVPVILVVDAKGMSGSIVPLVAGFCDYADKLGFQISGIIANRVGSDHHATLLDGLLSDHQLSPLLGWMKKNAPVLPERHLGLTPPEETNVPDFSAEFTLKKRDLLKALAPFNSPTITPNQSPALLAGKTIAIANDAACCFIYPANLDWLIAQGAKLHFFSPIKGDDLPPDSDALWLPGGYPELYTQALSESSSWVSINQFIAADKPVLAECGGAMLLGEFIIDLDGKSWPMANSLPYGSVMKDRLVSLGYRQENSGIRGHEFHHSARINAENLPSCFELNRGDKGIRYKKVRASYIHWYFASAPNVIAGWLS